MSKQVVSKLQTIKFIENLLSASVDGIVVTDANQEIIMVNKSFCSSFGLSNDDMIETNLLEWLKRVDGKRGKDPKIEILAKGDCEKQERKF